LGSGFTVKANSLDTINDESDGTVSSAGGTLYCDGTMTLISDGLHHWYVVYKN